jgi:ABC-type transport system substrate-binding protein
MHSRRHYSSEALKHFFVVALLFLLPCSCSSRNRIEGYVYYRLNTNPTTLDPARIVDVAGGSISAKLFNGLVKIGGNLDVVPDIAEKWEVSDSGTNYVFHLKHGIKFSNNREVTADDFKYSFKRILDPKSKSPNTWVLDKILGAKDYMKHKANDVSGIEILGKYTLKIRLERPFSPFLSLLTMTAAYVVPREEVEKWGPDFSTHPAGTGPFVVRTWNHNSELVLRRNDGYFGGRAKAEGIVYKIIPEDLTAVTEFETGNLDVLSIPASEYSKYRKSPEWSGLISSIKGLNTYYLGFNCSRPPFDDPSLRKAVSYAIDREKILRTFYEGRGRLAKGPVPDVLRHWELKVTQEYSPEAAREIINRRGYAGREINFFVTTDREGGIDIAEIIQSYLKKVGLRVKITQLEWSAYKAALNKGEADMFWISWWADYPDPENFLFPLFHSGNHGASGNRAWYTNEEVDRLIEEGQRALTLRERDSYYMKAEEIICRESPWVFFWHRTDFTVRQGYLKGYKIYPIYSMDKGVEVSP